MACLCEQIAGGDIDLSATCIGHLWIFQNLEAEDIKALSRVPAEGDPDSGISPDTSWEV